jgi:hypothetical protein
MDAAEALPILRALADGRDPHSGAPLGPESVFQRPEVIRALFAAVLVLDGAPAPRAEAAKTRPTSGAGSPWTAEEERWLTEGFRSGVSPAEIAREHGRTTGAITSRLVKLGLIAKDETPPGGTPDASPPTPAGDVPF